MSDPMISGWERTPAYMLLLNAFLKPTSPEELDSAVPWEQVLGRSPIEIIEQYVSLGLLEYAGQGLPLAAKLRRLSNEDLKEMLKERGLRSSGRKTRLIARLVDADEQGVAQAMDRIKILLCTEAGRTAVAAYFASIGSPADVEATLSATVPMPAPDSPFSWLGARLRGDLRDATPSGEVTKAVDTAASPTEADVELARKHIRRGHDFGAQEDFVQALLEFDLALDLDPQNAETHFWRGVVLKRLGDHHQALTDFAQAAELQHEGAAVYLGYGDTYLAMENWHLAITQYDLALARNPGLVEAYHNRGVAYERLGDLERARDSYEQALDLNPNAAEPHFGLGTIYAQMGDTARAAAEFETVLELASNEAIASQAREQMQRIEG